MSPAPKKPAPAKKPVPKLIDLDAQRAARGEAQPGRLRFMGQEWELPGEMPLAFAEHAAEGRVREAIGDLIGDRAGEFFELEPTVNDMEAFAEGAMSMYGMESGEAPASSGS